MNMLQKISLIVLIFLSVTARAQLPLEVTAGYSYNSIFDQTDTYRTYARSGFCFGAILPVKTFKIFVLQSGLEYVQKNYLWRRTGNYSQIFERRSNSYLSLPVLAQMRVVKTRDLALVVTSGLFGSYLLSRNVEGAIPNVFNSTTDLLQDGEIVQNFRMTRYDFRNKFNKQNDVRYEWGIAGGLQIQYTGLPGFTPLLKAHYYQGLTRVSRNSSREGLNSTNHTLVVSGGVILKL
jgi:hypothetical protein